MPLDGKKRKLFTAGQCAVEGVSQRRQKKFITKISPAAASNSFSKDNEKSQPQPQKKGRPSIIDSGDENRTLTHEIDCFRSHFRPACLFVMLE